MRLSFTDNAGRTYQARLEERLVGLVILDGIIGDSLGAGLHISYHAVVPWIDYSNLDLVVTNLDGSGDIYYIRCMPYHAHGLAIDGNFGQVLDLAQVKQYA